MAVLSAGLARAQSAPITSIQEECAAPAFAPDGRLAYAVRRIVKVRRFEIQRDDIWLVPPGGKPRRIVDGEKLVRAATPFSYSIQSMRWSPDGERLTVEMLTSELLDVEGNTKDGELTLLIDQSGKEIKIGRGDSVIENAFNAAWLGDGATVAFLNEAVKPKLLFSIETARPVSGRGDIPFPNAAFTAVAWDPPRSAAVAIERDKELRSPARLTWLDIPKHTRRDLGPVDNYSGGLSLSPSGKRVAFFRGGDILEIRDVEQPEKIARVNVAAGAYQWAAGEHRILLKRGELRKTSSLVWVPVPAPATPPSGNPAEKEIEPALSALTFRDFALSPDGKWLAVIAPGTRYLSVYAIP